MHNFLRLSCLTLLLFVFTTSKAQFDEDQIGSWYMYFWNTTIGEGPWGFQGDIQHRNWNVLGDMEQLMLRGGVTYKPKNANIKFTQGYAHIRTGAFGTDDSSTTGEHRIYQEALIPNKVGDRFMLTHRLRHEQRFVEGQDFRTRWRYALFMNIPFNNKSLEKGTIYLALYNELFINAQRSIGNGNEVELFDRNRLYGGIGYSISNTLRTQLGVMEQTTDNWQKTQLQVSLHHKF